ncbi:DUF1761 domain-containing protein [Bacillus infantis]|uniref:DUF1761 domain-containing protein n=1 Tax=Bacillus infantis TaxID=324767 RepID=UPI00101C2344|nr:DUF1761 domain-containing protein [Bacillus infantis]RYI27636.1 DUF1761 domain-containing protein [Bacillus infantis]
MSIDWSSISLLPVIAGGMVYILYGGIYYSIALSKKYTSNHEIINKQSQGPFKYIYSVIIAFMISYLIAAVLQATGSDSLLDGAVLGFSAGLLISIVYVKNALFGLVTKKSLVIAVGDHIIAFTMVGMVVGLFL